MAPRRGMNTLVSMANNPRVHLAAGLVALVASAADVLDVALVDIVGFDTGSEVALLSGATLHVLKGVVDICERSERIRESRRARLAEARAATHRVREPDGPRASGVPCRHTDPDSGSRGEG